MNRIIMTAIAAATFGSVAYADQSATADTLMTRSEPASVTVFERDRSVFGSDVVAGTSGAPSMVDAGLILDPRDQGVAVNGQVTVYSFPSARSDTGISILSR